MIQVQFLKDIYYKGSVYKKGSKLSMHHLDAEAMEKRGRVKVVESIKMDAPKPIKRKRTKKTK